MKKVITYLLVSVIASYSINAQNCESISPYKQGMTLEYTNYNKKGKAKDVENYEVLSVDNTTDEMVITLKQNINKKESGTFKLKCNNGNFYVDMTGYLSNHDSANGFGINAEGSFLVFPKSLKSGDDLPDGEIRVGKDDIYATMFIVNRKVKEKGQITTKAKTFEGYKITFDFIFELGPVKFRGSGEEWYVDGVGIVKSYSYNKAGKLKSSRELTKIGN